MVHLLHAWGSVREGGAAACVEAFSPLDHWHICRRGLGDGRLPVRGPSDIALAWNCTLMLKRLLEGHGPPHGLQQPCIHLRCTS